MSSSGPVEERLPLTPLSLAILLALAEEPLHGYGVMKALEARPGPSLVAGAGSLYAALDRMAEEGLLSVEEEAGSGRRRRTFAITPLGRRAALAETARMQAELRMAREKDLAPEEA